MTLLDQLRLQEQRRLAAAWEERREAPPLVTRLGRTRRERYLDDVLACCTERALRQAERNGDRP